MTAPKTAFSSSLPRPAVLGFDHIEMFVGNVRQAAHYYQSIWGFQPVAYRAAGPDSQDRSSIMMRQGDMRLMITGAVSAASPVAEHLRVHGEGVSTIGLIVDDVSGAFREAVSHGATPISEPATVRDEEGEITSGEVRVLNGFTHTLIGRSEYRGDFLPGFQAIRSSEALQPLFAELDHIAVAVQGGTLNSWVDFYKDTFGFELLHKEDVATEYTGMNSMVVQHPSGKCKLPLVEPAQGKRKSQIQVFLDSHNGPGVQHLAVRTLDIVDSVRRLRNSGVEFLPVPSTYYDELENRVGALGGDLAVLRNLGILVDHDEWGLLLQVFTRPVHDRPTMFFEVIERRGARGFGGGNIRALFRVHRERAGLAECRMSEEGALGRAFEPTLASWTQTARRSAIQDALILSARSGIISFSLGMPCPDLFPLELFRNASAEVLGRGSRALQYGPPSAVLKSHIVSLMRARGIECKETQIFLTNGAQQAVHLIIAMILNCGQKVIAEEFCYPGFQQIVEFYKPEILTVTTDLRTGMDVDKVEWYLTRGARPAFIYAISDGHNPLGVSLSEEKRNRLVSLSQKYRVPIIEEDPYGFLSYGPNPIKPMRAFEAENIFYVGSFSKILAPSVRVGWLLVPEKFMPYLAILKESSDIDMATFAQHVVASMLDSGFLPQHLDLLRSEYQRRRDLMFEGVSERFPANSMLIRPESGVFLWVQLPEAFDTTELLKSAVESYGVAFMPGAAFSAGGAVKGARNCMRLNFSHPSPARIEEGVLRLGQMFSSVANGRVAVG